ncbi:DUF998 domain-containing protein [Demequina lutea]|nr:DUF998 domain-containing protein [Demequina lutea]
MFNRRNGLNLRISKVLAVAAGLAYCSWPLGYVLNPLVSRRGLASELAALHQPYNWVFIALDVVAGALIVAVSRLLWHRGDGRANKVVLVNFALFGLLTAIDALLPMSCEPSLTTCPSLSHQPMLVLHGIASITASICLFISAVLVWWQRRNQTGATIMSAFMVGWILFGIFSLYFLFRPGPGYLAQHYYITLCSVWTAALPFMLEPRNARIVSAGR